MTPDLFALTQDSDGRTERVRRVVVSIFLVVILLQPAAPLFVGLRSGLEWFQLAGALTLTGIVLWQLTSAADGPLRTQWLRFGAGPCDRPVRRRGPSWLAAHAVAAAMCCRRRIPPPGSRPAQPAGVTMG